MEKGKAAAVAERDVDVAEMVAGMGTEECVEWVDKTDEDMGST